MVKTDATEMLVATSDVLIDSSDLVVQTDAGDVEVQRENIPIDMKTCHEWQC
jgi:hypothetical protein